MPLTQIGGGASNTIGKCLTLITLLRYVNVGNYSFVVILLWKQVNKWMMEEKEIHERRTWLATPEGRLTMSKDSWYRY